MSKEILILGRKYYLEEWLNFMIREYPGYTFIPIMLDEDREIINFNSIKLLHNYHKWIYIFEGF